MKWQGAAMLAAGLLIGVVLTVATLSASGRGFGLQLCPVPGPLTSQTSAEGGSPEAPWSAR